MARQVGISSWHVKHCKSSVRVTKLTFLLMWTVRTCCVWMFPMVITKVTLCSNNILTVVTAVNCKILIYWETFQRATHDLHTLYEERTWSKYVPPILRDIWHNIALLLSYPVSFLPSGNSNVKLNRSKEHWWNDADTGKLQYWEKDLSQMFFVATSSTWTDSLWPTVQLLTSWAMARQRIACNKCLTVQFTNHRKHTIPSATFSRLMLDRAISCI